jgi:hypothetical protein
MASLEDRLRSELRQIVDDTMGQGSVRPLRAPARRLRPGLVRWLAPVAAMVAVVGVIAGVSLARSLAPHQSAAAITGMPPYYVTVDYVTVDHAENATATVHASATGKVLSSTRLPAARNVPTGQSFFWSISAAADDQTFLIQQVRQLFVLRLSPNGRSAQLSQLPVRLPPTASVALSPDGSTAAIESMSSCKTTTVSPNYDAPACTNTEIRLISVDSGAITRTWSTEVLTVQSTWISWTRASQILFEWPGISPASPQPASLRLLDVTAAGSNLLAAHVLPVQIGDGPPFQTPYAFLTPDGSTVIFSTTSSDGSAVSGQAASARTGRLLYVLGQGTQAYPVQGCDVLSMGPAGLHALVSCGPASLGRVDNGRFTRLPGITDSWGVAAW